MTDDVRTTDKNAGAPLDLAAAFDMVPLHRSFGVELVQGDAGVEVVGALTTAAARIEDMPMAHGGAVATLLDSAATFAILADTGRPWATIDLRVDYLRPVPLGQIRITTEVVRAGSKVGRVQARLVEGAGRLCATATITLIPE